MSKAVSGVILTLHLTGMLASTLAVTSGNWVLVRDTVTGYYGEAVVGAGDCIYIARRSSFYRYRPADNSWTVMAIPPNPDSGDAFKTGTALAWNHDDHIYALYGAATGDSRRWFHRYSISHDSWEALDNTPADQGEGDAIAWCGLDNRIYATIGGEQRLTYFVRYDPSTDSWSDVPEDSPEGMGDGASFVWIGGNFLYALRGEFLEESPLYDFWRYNLVNDTWETMADIPAYPHEGGVGGVGDGGSLLYVGFWLQNQTDYIYALSGNQPYPEGTDIIPDHRYYRYTISTNSWERLADLPFGIGYYVGCRLGYADGHIYAWQGSPSTWTSGGDDLARYDFPSLTVIDEAVNYLTSHFNTTVGLIYESEDPGGRTVNGTFHHHNETYWLYNDNFIATWALKPFATWVSEKINETIQYYNLLPSQMIEVLFDYPIPKNISVGVQLVVEQHPDMVIMAEFHNSSTPLLWRKYGDTLIYQSLNEYLRGNMTGAVDYFDKAYNMWDGKGIYDLATEENHTYANYKLALILYAHKVLNPSVANYPHITQIEDKLWNMQNQSTGGITSLADLNGNPVGSANAETTSMALLPYNEELISRMHSLFGAYKHDVAVVSVVPSTSEAYAGQIVNITVIIENEGDFTETFNVTAYANHQILEFIITVQTKTVTNLPPGNQSTLTLSWNTTDVALGNYTISAEASVVPGETYATDNVKVNGIVHVIPEFASMLLLFVVFVATMVVSMFMKRRLMLKSPSPKISRIKTQT